MTTRFKKPRASYALSLAAALAPGVGLALVVGLTLAACLPADPDFCATGDVSCSPGALIQYIERDTDTCLTQRGGSIQPCLPMELSGLTSTLAGDGTGAFLDGTGTAARFNQPASMATDGTWLFLADFANVRIRRVNLSTSAVDTLAGDGTPASTDGFGTAAQFSGPFDLALVGDDLYVADALGNRIRKIDLDTTEVTTFAGDGSAAYLDGVGTAAQFNTPAGITSDGSYLYVGDVNNHRIRKIDIASRTVTTLAGDGTAAHLDGVGTAARINGPQGVATDGSFLYVAETGAHYIRRIDLATNEVTTLAGDGTAGDSDGIGTAASFSSPEYLVTDGSSVYFGTNHRVRRLELATAAVTSLAGDGTSAYQDGTGTNARFNYIRGMASDGFRLYVAGHNNNRIRKVE